jgi:inositol transport system substrate-binding protein
MLQALTRLVLGAVVMVSAAQATPAAAEDKTILISFSKASYPFFEAVRVHAEDEARQLGVRVIFADGKGDSTIQATALENAIAPGRVDGVLIAPNDIYALVPSVNYVLQQGVPLVTFDTRVRGASRDVPHVGIDNVEGGRILAGWVVDNLPGGAKVLHLTGLPGSSSGIDRAKGVREGLAAAGSKYEIVGEASANWSRTEGMLVTEGQLTFLPKPPDAIIADNDDMATGAIEAIRQTGRDPRAIKVVGFDALPFALQAVREGTLAATVDQKPGAQIRTALRMMSEHLRSGAPLRSVEIEPVLITKDNLHDAEIAPRVSQ